MNWWFPWRCAAGILWALLRLWWQNRGRHGETVVTFEVNLLLVPVTVDEEWAELQKETR